MCYIFSFYVELVTIAFSGWIANSMENYHDFHHKSMDIIRDKIINLWLHLWFKCSYVDGSHYVTLWHPDDLCTSIVQYKNREFAKSVVVKTSTFLVPGIMTILKDVRI